VLHGLSALSCFLREPTQLRKATSMKLLAISTVRYSYRIGLVPDAAAGTGSSRGGREHLIVYGVWSLESGGMTNRSRPILCSSLPCFSLQCALCTVHSALCSAALLSERLRLHVRLHVRLRWPDLAPFLHSRSSPIAPGRDKR